MFTCYSHTCSQNGPSSHAHTHTNIHCTRGLVDQCRQLFLSLSSHSPTSSFVLVMQLETKTRIKKKNQDEWTGRGWLQCDSLMAGQREGWKIKRINASIRSFSSSWMRDVFGLWGKTDLPRSWVSHTYTSKNRAYGVEGLSGFTERGIGRGSKQICIV